MDYRKDQPLRATQRPFSRTAYIPDEGVNRLSRFTFPANIVVAPRIGQPGLLNPAYATGCAPPTTLALSDGPPICLFDYASLIDIVPAAERTSAIGRATFAIDSANQIFAEFIQARNRIGYAVTPTPSGSIPAIYPADGPFYPAALDAQGFARDDLVLLYRTVPLGARTDRITTDAWRALIGAEGTWAGWELQRSGFLRPQPRDGRLRCAATYRASCSPPRSRAAS